jgi:hypothetical protein
MGDMYISHLLAPRIIVFIRHREKQEAVVQPAG